MAKRKIRKKIVKKNIAKGVVHIAASFNNTLVTVSDEAGNVICWSSAETVTKVLLKDAAICTTPLAIFFLTIFFLILRFAIIFLI